MKYYLKVRSSRILWRYSNDFTIIALILIILTMILYAPSYISLIYYYNNYNIPDWKVITRNESIYKFCQKLEVEVFYFEIEKDLSRAGLIKYKNDIKSFVDKININGESILYCYYLCGIVDYYIIKQLSKNNLIYFINLDPIFESANISNIFKIEYLRKVQNKIIYFVFFGVYSKIYYGDNRFWLGIKNPMGFKFKSNENISIAAENNKYIIRKFKLPKFDYIYIDNIQEFMIDDIKEMNNILKEIESKGFSVAVKLHPGDSNEFLSFHKLPPFIPAELLIPFAKKAIIGVSSASLLHISKNIQTISVINIINNNHGDWKNNYTKFLLNKKIKLPLNKDELFSLIS